MLRVRGANGAPNQPGADMTRTRRMTPAEISAADLPALRAQYRAIRTEIMAAYRWTARQADVEIRGMAHQLAGAWLPRNCPVRMVGAAQVIAHPLLRGE